MDSYYLLRDAFAISVIPLDFRKFRLLRSGPKRPPMGLIHNIMSQDGCSISPSTMIAAQVCVRRLTYEGQSKVTSRSPQYDELDGTHGGEYSPDFVHEIRDLGRTLQ